MFDGIRNLKDIARWFWRLMCEQCQSEPNDWDASYDWSLWPWWYWGVFEAADSHENSPWWRR